MTLFSVALPRDPSLRLAKERCWTLASRISPTAGTHTRSLPAGKTLWPTLAPLDPALLGWLSPILSSTNPFRLWPVETDGIAGLGPTLCSLAASLHYWTALNLTNHGLWPQGSDQGAMPGVSSSRSWLVASLVPRSRRKHGSVATDRMAHTPHCCERVWLGLLRQNAKSLLRFCRSLAAPVGRSTHA
ncbi:hypothetical protein BCV70DRAFT_98958 [Testicularia cyperi]|uniref:Uncharacterized protein n=1 Tax=Testicularia cyperi TaxID=1882483 RepID=A0A317XQS2_9BASI|nr:hypothetical protein BCV70DRAFT_98958 [Testicularia cyperi]